MKTGNVNSPCNIPLGLVILIPADLHDVFYYLVYIVLLLVVTGGLLNTEAPWPWFVHTGLNPPVCLRGSSLGSVAYSLVRGNK